MLEKQKKDTRNDVQDTDLFNNPMIRAAEAALSDKDKARYKELGEEMYGSLNFEENKVINNIPPPMQEAVTYLEYQLRSGLHPSDMEEKEKILLQDIYGEEWYKKWNFVKEDLNEIFTIKH